jgi:sigma-B regulation protein RsbU (phosphoserine phosphatase)
LTWAFVLSIGLAVAVAGVVSGVLNSFRAQAAAEEAVHRAGASAALNTADREGVVWEPDGRGYAWRNVTVQPVKILRRGETVEGSVYRASRQDPNGQTAYTDIVVDSPLGDYGTSLTLTLILSGLVVVAVGVGVAFLLARRVVGPLTMLIEDVRILSHGNLDHKVSVHSGGEVGLLAKSVDRMIRGLRDAREKEREAEMREHELAVAAEVRTSLLPEKLMQIPGYEMGAYLAAADSVGGDLYDTIDRVGGTSSSAVFVAGISTRGVPGAMLMTMARAYLHQALEGNASPVDALKQANRAITRDMRRGLYVTAIVATLDPATGRVKVVSAGHKAPLLHFRAMQQKVEAVHPEGIALGFDPGPVFDRTIQETEIELLPGDRIVLSNAGIASVRGVDGSELGEARFAALVGKHATKVSEAFCQLLGAELERYRGEAALEDDIVIVTLRRKAGAKP